MATISSWRNRRWKIFENINETDPEFRKRLLKVYNKNPISVENLENLLIEYGIPIYCKVAIIIFINHPNLNRREYLHYIQPPIFYWNAEAEYMGPSPTSPSQHYERLSKEIEKNLGRNDFLGVDYNKLDFEALTHFVSNNSTVIHVTSFVNKSEMHELINEYWEELELLLNYRYKIGDKLYSEKLLEKIQPSPPKGLIERNKLILELTENGANDDEIAWQLSMKGYVSVNTGNIRTIRSRIRSQQAKKKK